MLALTLRLPPRGALASRVTRTLRLLAENLITQPIALITVGRSRSPSCRRPRTAEQVVENQKVHAERRMAKEGEKKALYNDSKVRSFHAAAGADTSIV